MSGEFCDRRRKRREGHGRGFARGVSGYVQQRAGSSASTSSENTVAPCIPQTGRHGATSPRSRYVTSQIWEGGQKYVSLFYPLIALVTLPCPQESLQKFIGSYCSRSCAITPKPMELKTFQLPFPSPPAHPQHPSICLQHSVPAEPAQHRSDQGTPAQIPGIPNLPPPSFIWVPFPPLPPAHPMQLGLLGVSQRKVQRQH